MALSQKLEFRQSQSLVMTPQLMQAIKLLQLSNLDLVAYVDAELERNPLLEREEPDTSRPETASDAFDARSPEPLSGPSGLADGEFDGHVPGSDSAGASSSGGGDDGEVIGPAPLEAALSASAASVAAEMDTDPRDLYADDAGSESLDPARLVGDSWSTASRAGGEDLGLDGFAARDVSLRDYLEEQVALAFADPVRRLIARDLIDAVDEAGYLRTDLESVAERLGTSLALVEETLGVLQGFDPPGVFARDLGECLALQLKERNRLDPAMKALVDNLPLVARRDFAALRRICGVDDEDVADMVRELRGLDPKPGLAFGESSVQAIVPDVVVQAAANGEWIVELNSDTLPKVLVNQSYYSRVVRTTKPGEERAYLSDCLQTANWLVKSLDQRAKTILKVASEIVRQQDAFFAHGVAHLRPLNLRTVAEAIGMHESTVSRVTANKYMATTRGIFELKYFFTSSIAASDGGDAHSAEAVRHRIRALIDAEPADAVLSDDAIVQTLKDAGVDIARRTVAKYRESMRIPSSVQRRREKIAAQIGR